MFFASIARLSYVVSRSLCLSREAEPHVGRCYWREKHSSTLRTPCATLRKELRSLLHRIMPRSTIFISIVYFKQSLGSNELPCEFRRWRKSINSRHSSDFEPLSIFHSLSNSQRLWERYSRCTISWLLRERERERKKMYVNTNLIVSLSLDRLEIITRYLRLFAVWNFVLDSF